DRADEPQRRLPEIEAVPRLEKMMNPFSLDERAGKNRAEKRRTDAGFEPLDIHSSREIKQLLFRETLDPEGVGCFFGKNEKQGGEIVLFQETLPGLEEVFFPGSIGRGRTARSAVGHHFSAIAMPGWNFHDGRNPKLVCYSERLQAIARPAVEKIITPGREMPRRDPVEVLLLCSVIVRAVEKRNEPHRMPAQGMDVAGRDFALAIIVGDGAPEKSAAMRGAQGFEGIRVQAGPADPRKDRVK